MKGKKVSLNGLSVTAPDGWADESFVNENGMTILRLGSYSFPTDASDDVGQTARGALGSRDILINIIDFTATDPGTANDAYQPISAPPTIDPALALQQEGYTAPAAAIRFVHFDDHNLHVSVAFGSAPPSTDQLSVANAVLGTLTVG